MKIHANLNLDAQVNQDDLYWVKSPQKGVLRKMIERDGQEVARATSIVKYEPQSFFPEHTHDMGEEYLVLEGVFSDESGDFKNGTYVRNPWGSKHQPFSKVGCSIFVKLRQMHPEDQEYIRTHHHDAQFFPINEVLEVAPIHNFGSESVAFMKTSSDYHWQSLLSGSFEVFIINGEISSKGEQLLAHSWLRFASKNDVDFTIKKDSLLLVKTGHLPEVNLSTKPVNWAELLSTKEY
jgi:hypothetical protein